MYSECPNCHAIFRVTPEVLERAGGQVRCGECQTVFLAAPIEEEMNASPDASPAAAANHTFDRTVQDDDQTLEIEGLYDFTATSEVSADQARSALPESSALELIPEPDLEQRAAFQAASSVEPVVPKQRKGRPFLMAFLAVVLIALLGLQFLLAHRMELGNHSVLRPLIVNICQVLGCSVAPRRDTSRIALVDNAVYSHPNAEHALMIKGVLANEADFPQPYPVIEISLSDLRGRVVALRRFGPNEYLDPATDTPPQMPVEGRIPIRLEVVDPGRNALAFEFRFL